MNQNRSISLLIVAAFVAFFLFLSMFTVHQTEYALVLRLGKVHRVDTEAGLHFKMPVIDDVRYFDNRILSLDADAEEFLTSEKKNVLVDSFVKWQIADVVQFFTTMGGSESRAGQRITEILADGLRSKFGSRTIQEVVSGDRAQIMGQITTEANSKVEQYGIKIVDVRIKRIDLPKGVSASVYSRMEAERERVARELRSRGEAAGVRIRAEADRQRVEVLAQAERDAEVIRGEGEATAADIFAQAFSQNPEFYALYRSLNAYRNVFRNKSDVLVLEPDSEFFKYFKQPVPAAPAATQ
jgi:membrane protease subunit HflC